MKTLHCIASATIGGRLIAAAYSGLEDSPLPPEEKTWADGEQALRVMAGRQAQVAISQEEEAKKDAS